VAPLGLEPIDLPRRKRNNRLIMQQQLAALNRMAGSVQELSSDNSNTQFATLALWVARRYGLPVEPALKRVEARFRGSQQADGGWGYFDPGAATGQLAGSTASMTCAGLLGLAVAAGKVSETARAKKSDGKGGRDINKDPHLRNGLLALSTAIGQPQGGLRRRPPHHQLPGQRPVVRWHRVRVEQPHHRVHRSGADLRDANLDPRALDLKTRQSIGVMLGSGGGAVEFSERMYELWCNDATKQASIYSIPSGTIGTISSEISMAYDLHGFSHLISTGCTSSTDAIGYAYRNLKLGIVDYVICGGADATITEGVMTGFCIMRIVLNTRHDAPSTASCPFSRDRDGFVLAEGAWMFVM